MNTTADPCKDFNNFACGNWKKYHPTNRTVTQTRNFVMAHEEFNRQISQMLSSSDATDTETERKVKNFYNSCLKMASLPWDNLQNKLLEIVKEFGEMPILKGSKWREEDFDWLKTVAEISHKYGYNIILGPTIQTDWNDRSVNRIVMNSQEFLAKRLGARPEAYQPIVSGMLEVYFDVKPKESARLAQEIVDFEFLLYEGKNPKVNLLKITNVKEMQKKYSPHLDVMKLMNISFGSIPSGEIAILSPGYIQDVIDALQITPKRVVANYIFFHLVAEFTHILPNPTKFEADCIRHTNEFFPKIIISMLYDGDESDDLRKTRQELEVMWQEVKSIAEQILHFDDFGGFDEATRDDALAKVHSMQLEMPLYKRNSFGGEYQNLNISNLDYIENLKSLRTFKAQQQRASLAEKPNYVDLVLKLSTPIYINKANIIIFPPTILTTDYYWSKSLPKAFNYGRLGFLVAHELVHSFSGFGRFYNKFGKLVDNIYEEIEHDMERRSCLYEQYFNISYGGRPLPQDDLQTENVADNVGIAIAVEAYRRWYEGSGRTPQEIELESLPLLNYTSQQLFYINYSQMWCSDTLEDLRAGAAAADKHSPDDVRTYMPLRNLVTFSEEFNCPKGSPMNPLVKCNRF